MYSKRKGSRAVSHGLATTGNKIYCTLWIREAVMPNWGFWGNLGFDCRSLTRLDPRPPQDIGPQCPSHTERPQCRTVRPWV